MSALLRHWGGARAVHAASARAALARTRVAIPHQHQIRFLSAGRYIDQMRTAWKSDPASVHESWNSYFSKEPTSADSSAGTAVSTVTPELQEFASDHIKMLLLVRSYQVRGHYMCKLDPLGINDANLHVDKFAYRGSANQAESVPKFLDYKTYGFTEKDLDRQFYLNANVGGGMGGLIGTGQLMPLREILAIMEQAYCGTVGIEFTHIADLEQQNWIRSKFERKPKFVFDEKKTMRLLDRLIYGVLCPRFPSTKAQILTPEALQLWNSRRFSRRNTTRPSASGSRESTRSSLA